MSQRRKKVESDAALFLVPAQDSFVSRYSLGPTDFQFSQQIKCSYKYQ